MKITIVTGFFLPVPAVRGGSTEKIWHRLAQEFAARGHAVTLICRNWPGMEARETVDGVHYIRVRGTNHTSSLGLNLLHDVRWGIRVSRVLPPADVTICNTVTLPAWLHTRRSDVGLVCAVVARTPKGHGRFYGHVDVLLSLSAAVTTALLSENRRLAPKIVAFPYPIDCALQAAAAAGRSSYGPLTVGYVGRIHPEKGIALLLEAAAQLIDRREVPAWELRLIGPVAVAHGGGGEDYQRRLVAQFAPTLGDRLRFDGPEFDPQRLAAAYASIDVFCYPSLSARGETFGVAVAEAMAARCAPVVSQLPCFTELVTPEETGLVFDHSAPDAAGRLANSLARLLNDAALRDNIAARAQRRARQFDFTASATTLLQELDHRVKGHFTPPGS